MIRIISSFLLCTFFPTSGISQIVLGPKFDVENELRLCRTSIEGEKKYVIYDGASEGELYNNYSFREMFFGETSNISCPAFVSLQIMTPELSDEERIPFCLTYDENADTITGFALGERDAYLMCKEPGKPLCERVNESKNAAVALAGTFGAAAGGTTAAASATGVSVVTHSSGALILTGNAGYIAGTLGGVGTTLISILTAPAVLTAAGVSVVVVGGAVYACNDYESAKAE